MTSGALKFKHTQIPRQQGERARLKVVQGPDSGAIYVITAATARIGRGEDSDVILSDLKSSRVHAELFLDGTGWAVRDLKSANGILHNGKSAVTARLQFQDTITLGGTTLEFIKSDEVGTQILMSPAQMVSQAQESSLKTGLLSEVTIPGIAGLNLGFLKSPAKGSLGATSGASQTRKNFLIGGAVLFLLFFILKGDEKPKAPERKAETNIDSRNLASYLPPSENNKAADVLFKDGFREYISGNYNRARTQFETVLQISPNHTLANLYLENCNKSVEGEVKLHLESGKRSRISGKLKDARAHFERVLRLLYKDQTNPSFLEAREQLEVTRKMISGEAGG